MAGGGGRSAPPRSRGIMPLPSDRSPPRVGSRAQASATRARPNPPAHLGGPLQPSRSSPEGAETRMRSLAERRASAAEESAGRRQAPLTFGLSRRRIPAAPAPSGLRAAAFLRSPRPIVPPAVLPPSASKRHKD